MLFSLGTRKSLQLRRPRPGSRTGLSLERIGGSFLSSGFDFLFSGAVSSFLLEMVLFELYWIMWQFFFFFLDTTELRNEINAILL